MKLGNVIIEAASSGAAFIPKGKLGKPIKDRSDRSINDINRESQNKKRIMINGIEKKVQYCIHCNVFYVEHNNELYEIAYDSDIDFKFIAATPLNGKFITWTILSVFDSAIYTVKYFKNPQNTAWTYIIPDIIIKGNIIDNKFVILSKDLYEKMLTASKVDIIKFANAKITEATLSRQQAILSDLDNKPDIKELLVKSK